MQRPALSPPTPHEHIAERLVVTMHDAVANHADAVTVSDRSSCGWAGAGVAAEGDAKLPQELPVGPRRGRPPGACPLRFNISLRVKGYIEYVEPKPQHSNKRKPLKSIC